jgi:hypothetical protein
VYIFGRDQGLRPNIFVKASTLKKDSLDFLEKYGSTDMYEYKNVKDPEIMYQRLIRNTMARIYTYCTQRLFIRGKVETFNIIIDLESLTYSQCKEVSF